tara:strand:- start:1707 stop:1952 length:246 start_codon:yes stop_codon:yes gene_type:complete
MVKQYKIVGVCCYDNYGPRHRKSSYAQYTEMHDTDCYNAAKGWVVGYVRFDGLRQSGYDAIIITHEGEHQARFDECGWTHY